MAHNAEPSARAALWRSVTRLDKSKINPKWMAFRNSLAVALPLAIGIGVGKPLGGVAVTTGALNVCYSDGTDPYARRARRMLNWSFLGALAVFIGSVSGHFHIAAIFVAAAWAFIAGMCASISTKAGDLGTNTLVAVIVFSARGALPPKGALIAAALVLGGGLLQAAFALLLWPVRKNKPERRAVGQVYLGLAKELKLGSETLVSTPLKPASTQVQDTLSALGKDHSLEGERFRLLFDQADRIRMSAFLVSRLQAELQHEQRRPNANGNQAEGIGQLLETSSALVTAVGQCLLAGTCVEQEKAMLDRIHAFTNAAHNLDSSSPLRAELSSAADVLAGQLRVAAELADHVTPEGLKGFEAREARHPWRLQAANWIATLRANLDWRSTFFRHAVRLAVCVALADAIARTISWERSYWIPMTAAVILKPDFTTTFSRGLLRLAGTLAGLIVATILYHALPASAWRQLILVGMFTFAFRWIGPANYGIFSVAISGLIVFLIAATGIKPAQVVTLRGLNTAAGGLLALIAYALWPTWERTQVSEALAEMLEVSRNYLQAVVQRFKSADPSSEALLNRSRDEWRRARSNAEGSVDRVGSEPKITSEKLDCLTSILASSHALMHAMIGLEAGALQAPAQSCPEAFEKFAQDAEFTLYFLAAALRGSSAAASTLPKLREDHRRLIESRAASPADEFVVIETDRMTVSLNTLREQVMKFVA